MHEPKHLEILRRRVQGDVFGRADPGYHDARSIWNAMIDRHPAVIVMCEGNEDVVAAIEFARSEGLPLSVKGGGHSVAGNGLCEGGVTLDLSRMNQVMVDAGRRRARAGGGARWADFDREAQAFNLTCTGGVVSSTGVAGLTLGGGIGYLTRSYGLSCDNLAGADVVTADGCVVHASAAEHADLFWALRGGGGNFGVVTALEFQLHEVGPMVATAMVFHPLDAAGEALRFYRDYSAEAPDAVACYAMFVNAPPDFPPQYQGMPVLAFVACHSGDVEEGKRALAPLGDFGRPLVASVDAMPYTVLQTAFDAGNPPGQRYYWKSHHLSGLPDELIDTLVRFVADFRGSWTIIGIEPLGGALARVDPSATAFAHRHVPYSLGIWSGWSDPAEDATNMAWTRAFFEATRPFSAGVYVNYLGEDEGGRIDEAYGANLVRLVETKRQWDPDNLFRINQNIAPG